MAPEMEKEKENPDLLTSPARLAKIDALREKNIGKHLPLPQLVVVGDQSSGKSSLLETLTGIPFPRGQELCTRYATQITSRRDTDARIEITIIPGPRASEEAKKNLEAYNKRVADTNELRSQFVAILDEVNRRMNIRTNTSSDNASERSKTFSEDILKIEICGPSEDYLTVIDVPGIFRLLTEGVTTADDRKLVENMVRGYIKDSRTIILAVLPSNVDIATQEILALAEEYDKAGERTLGVLTKPDLVTERSAQAALCGLVQGKRRPLALGYYVVRNRGGDEDDAASQPNREDMFAEEPWRSLPEDRVGVGALKARLAELLSNITDREFPLLRRDARQMLAAAKKEYDQLGAPRQTEKEQQIYLCRIAGQFQNMVRAALQADYSHDVEAFDNNEDVRLITRVADLTEGFGMDIATMGHYIPFQGLKPKDDVEYTSDDETEDDTPENSARYSDIEDMLLLDLGIDAPVGDIKEWIKDLFKRSRGMEIGGAHAGILSSAFREQSQKWDSITKVYLSGVVRAIHIFINDALAHLCHEKRIREEIMSALLGELRKRYAVGMGHSDFLLTVEREARPYTLDSSFSDNTQKCRGERIAHMLKEHVHTPHRDQPMVRLEMIKSATMNKSNTERMTEDIHDNLQSYYNVARKRFVDNVYIQAVDHLLLTGPQSPLRVFCEAWVIDLDAEQLNAIAGESLATRNRRERLRQKIEDLESTMKILK